MTDRPAKHTGPYPAEKYPMTILIVLGGVWAVMATVFGVAVCMAASKPLPEPGGQLGTILAIDDDTAMLDVTRLALENEGYQVHSVSSPKEAIKFYENHWQNIKLVLLDFLMPEMTGDQVFASLRICNPQVPVLLVTGHYQSIQAPEFKSGVRGCLSKPFLLNDLIQKVGDAIRL